MWNEKGNTVASGKMTHLRACGAEENAGETYRNGAPGKPRRRIERD
ncbi:MULTISPECIES: hypothetical protein [Burkholderia]|nr:MULTISPECIES: hypothetical protein [Burkholderia]